MSEKNISLGRLFLQEAIRAGTRGVIYLVVMGVFICAIKQDIKEGIAFGVDRFIFQSILTTPNPDPVDKAKQHVQEGMEDASITSNNAPK